MRTPKINAFCLKCGTPMYWSLYLKKYICLQDNCGTFSWNTIFDLQ